MDHVFLAPLFLFFPVFAVFLFSFAFVIEDVGKK